MATGTVVPFVHMSLLRTGSPGKLPLGRHSLSDTQWETSETAHREGFPCVKKFSVDQRLLTAVIHSDFPIPGTILALCVHYVMSPYCAPGLARSLLMYHP